MTTEENNQSVYSCGCIPKLIRPCANFLTFLHTGYPIHPVQPAAPDCSEFVIINSKIQIRVIHVTPTHIQVPLVSPRSSVNRKRNANSLSEEYWFTRWNKPLKIGNCNCSFRRSLCFQAATTSPVSTDSGVNARNNNGHLNARTKVRLSTRERPPVKIINMDTYVERLLQETFFEAFQEYFMHQNMQSISGIDNPTYINSESNLEDVVLRRKKNSTPQLTVKADILSSDSIIIEQPVQNNQNLFVRNTNCDHLKTAKEVSFFSNHKAKQHHLYISETFTFTSSRYWLFFRHMVDCHH